MLLGWLEVGKIAQRRGARRNENRLNASHAIGFQPNEDTRLCLTILSSSRRFRPLQTVYIRLAHR